MSFWKKVVRFFAEASTPAEATRTLADRAKSEDARRAQIEIVESLSDRLPSSEPNAAVTARGIFHDLTIALADPEPWVRATAARGLREISGVFRYEVGDDVIQKALAALLLSAEDPDPTARARVASALSGLCDVAADADKARIATAIRRPICDEPLARVARGGGPSISRSCGEAASAFVPRLGELLADPDERVRGNAASALWMVGVPVDHAHVAKLSALLAADPSGRVRADTANALGKLGRDASDAVVPLLVRATAGTIHDVRHFAVFALSDFGPLAAPAVPRLGELLAQEEHREAAAIALRSVASAAAPPSSPATTCPRVRQWWPRSSRPERGRFVRGEQAVAPPADAGEPRVRGPHRRSLEGRRGAVAKAVAPRRGRAGVEPRGHPDLVLLEVEEHVSERDPDLARRAQRRERDIGRRARGPFARRRG